MKVLNRREFLHSASLLAGCTATGSTVFAQTKPNTRFEAPSPYLVGLNAYSFSKQLNAAVRQSGGGRKGVGGKRSGGGKAARSGLGKAGGSRQGEGSGQDKRTDGGGRKSGGGKAASQMTLPGLIAYCVEPEHKFDAVDLTGYYFPNYSATEATVPPDRFVDDIKRRSHDLGLAICGTGIGNSLTGVPFDREGKKGIVFSTDEGGDRALIATEVQRIKAWIQVAARLGATVLRVFTGLEPSYLMKEHIKPNDPQKEEKSQRLAAWRAETFKRMVDDLSEVVEYAKQFGVTIGIQNHGDFLKMASETIELVSAVNSDWIGVIVDTGYFLTPDPYIDIAEVLPWAVNFQIKEYVRKCPSQYQASEFHPIDMTRLMQIVRSSAYRGYLPIETVAAGNSGPVDPYKDVPALLGKLRAAIKETA